MTETVAAIVAAHRAGTLTPAETIARSYQRIRDYNDPAVFISLRDEKDAIAEAERLKSKNAAGLPLYGVPVGVKDNIDALGFQTTAACPAFAYTPVHDATSVAKLRAAGAIIIGKTNLDQFATGLVGVRSPYGIPNNPIRSDLIPGGSSSGSAVAVAAGLVPLALGTDTAGSGRVPAMLNNIVGLKPSLGMISTAGVAPACRTLDCVSVFSLTVDDAVTALAAMTGPDLADPFSRDRPLKQITPFPQRLRLGVPSKGQLIFFGDKASEAAYGDALKRWAALGADLVEFDMEPFYETARLLYEGPWVAERYLVIRKLLASSPDAIHPVTREITAAGARLTAAETFSALYRLQGLRKIAERTFANFDAIVLPTAPTVYSTKQVLADPIELNSRLGTYTNFVNLLDLCGLALPAAMRADDIPFGITLLAPARPRRAAGQHRPRVPRRHQIEDRRQGLAQPPLAPLPASTGDDIAIAVVGAHLSGMALNGELRTLGGRLLETAVTAPDYKLYALATTPPKPGMLRVDPGKANGDRAGDLVDVFLGLRPVRRRGAAAALDRHHPALRRPQRERFLVEAAGVEGARDISSFGGWRAYMAEKAAV